MLSSNSGELISMSKLKEIENGFINISSSYRFEKDVFRILILMKNEEK